MARVKYLTLPPGRRCLAVSDIHGNLPYFRGLLEKLRFSDEDTLLVLGDFVEKGEESLETLRFLMALMARGNVHALLGNCDGWYLDRALASPEVDGAIRRYIHRQKPHRGPGLLLQMCREADFSLAGDFDVAAMRTALAAHFPAEIAFLQALPHIIETEHFTFVHGGLPSGPSLAALSPVQCMKYDNFMTDGRRFDKWVVAGHTPVVLYGGERSEAAPRIDRESRIVSIDGGCVLREDGQLNALLLPSDGGGDFGCVAYDRFPVRRVLDAQAGSGHSAYIRWGDSVIDILDKGPEFSRCRHLRTGYELDILTDTIFTGRDGARHCEDCTDYRLPLEPGDEISVVRETSRGFLAKRRGVTGWYGGRLAEEQVEFSGAVDIVC